MNPAVKARTPHRGSAGQFARRIGIVLQGLEPVWILLMILGVYILSYLSFLERVAAIWAWLVLALGVALLVLRALRRGLGVLRTPFDVAIGILLVGAALGVWVSPDRTMSLRALQTLLACIVLFYSWSTNSHPRLLLKIALSLGAVWIAAMVVIAFNNTSLNLLDYMAPRSARAWIYRIPWLSHTSTPLPFNFELNYGLAFLVFMIAAFLAAAAFCVRRVRVKVMCAAAFLLTSGMLVLLNFWGISRMFRLESIQARLPFWSLTLRLIARSPLVGVGLGAWPLAAGRPSGTFVPYHPHNSYLQLYSDTGILGVAALCIALVVGGKMAWAILRSDKRNPWYAFGLGMVLASWGSALFGLVEKAPIGFFAFGAEAYYFGFSPLAALLAIGMILAYRLRKQTLDPSCRP